MMLVWKNMDTFKRHMEDMTSFRRAHPHLTPVEPKTQARAATIPLINNPPCRTNPTPLFTDAKGKTILVPIWEITTPKGSQN